MAVKDIWINLPVKDVKRSKEFFTNMGFRFNTTHGNTDQSACLLIGEKNVVVMLFEEPTFKGFTNKQITNTKSGIEVLLSVDAATKEEVDQMASNANLFGGHSDHKPSEMKGWMYGCLFSDPDGHCWNVLFMDHSKMPK